MELGRRTLAVILWGRSYLSSMVRSGSSARAGNLHVSKQRNELIGYPAVVAMAAYPHVEDVPELRQRIRYRAEHTITGGTHTRGKWSTEDM